MLNNVRSLSFLWREGYEARCRWTLPSRVEQAAGDFIKHFTARPLQYPAKHVPNIPDEFKWNNASPFLGLVWFHLWPTSTRVIKLSCTSYGINTLIDSNPHTQCVSFSRGSPMNSLLSLDCHWLSRPGPALPSDGVLGEQPFIDYPSNSLNRGR